MVDISAAQSNIIFPSTALWEKSGLGVDVGPGVDVTVDTGLLVGNKAAVTFRAWDRTDEGVLFSILAGVFRAGGLCTGSEKKEHGDNDLPDFLFTASPFQSRVTEKSQLSNVEG
jgi:hypothetical protein